VFCRLRLLNAGILASNAARQCKLNSSILCEKKQGRRRAGKWRGHFPLALSKGGGGAFFITVLWLISWFGKIELKQIYCSYSPYKKVRMVFNHFCYYVWGQYCCWTETKILVTICLFFLSFDFSQLLYSSPCLTIVWACLKMSMTDKKALLPTKRVLKPMYCSL